MIRASRPEDTNEMMAIAEASGLFEGDQLGTLRDTIERFFAGRTERDEFWFTDFEADRAVGVAYCASEPMTDRVWNLLFIAVHPERQGAGRGGAILGEVESELRSKGARMLIIETSSGDDFEDTRAFYRKHGYDQEGTIRDFYESGADKIVFRKLLES